MCKAFATACLTALVLGAACGQQRVTAVGRGKLCAMRPEYLRIDPLIHAPVPNIVT